jgi:hypothetical protein
MSRNIQEYNIIIEEYIWSKIGLQIDCFHLSIMLQSIQTFKEADAGFPVPYPRPYFNIIHKSMFVTRETREGWGGHC